MSSTVAGKLLRLISLTSRLYPFTDRQKRRSHDAYVSSVRYNYRVSSTWNQLNGESRP
jgi:hypothetical protein